MSKTPKDQSVYRVTDASDRTLGRVRAKSSAAARAFYTQTVVTEKLTIKDVIECVHRRLPIHDADTGLLIDADPETPSPDVEASPGGVVSQSDEE